MSRFLITGVAGFIGSSLARELLRQGHTVSGVDNLSTGSMMNLDTVSGDLDFHKDDINDTAKMRLHCRGVDFVLHHAALASVPRSVKNPLESHVANIDGTLSVLLAARDAGVARVIYAASSSAYGDQRTQPKREEMVPAPMSPYAVQKLAGEHYMRSFEHSYGLECVSLRYFNVFGPGQSADSPYSGVVARFITDMLHGIVPTIFGDGRQSRDFTYIDNVVAANLLACSALSSDVSGQVFNIGTGRSQTLNSLYEALATMLHFPVAPRYQEVRTGDIEHSQADITHARRCLGYRPLTRFDEGLNSTVEWYLEQEAGSALASNLMIRQGDPIPFYGT